MSDAEALDRPVSRIKPRGQGDGSGDTVTVACKMPGGIILQLYEMVPVMEPVMGGGSRETTRARLNHEAGEYYLNGAAVNLAEIGEGNLPDYRIVQGYALTTGIPKDFWERWLHDNRDAAIVKNKIVMAYGSESGAVDMAREHAGVKTGMEPLDPENPPADVRRVRKGTRNDNDADNL